MADIRGARGFSGNIGEKEWKATLQ